MTSLTDLGHKVDAIVWAIKKEPEERRQILAAAIRAAINKAVPTEPTERARELANKAWDEFNSPSVITSTKPKFMKAVTAAIQTAIDEAVRGRDSMW
jgi:hypothetical protein